MLPAGASARPGGTYPAFSSDDTLGEPDAGVDDVAAVKHFKRARLSRSSRAIDPFGN